MRSPPSWIECHVIAAWVDRSIRFAPCIEIRASFHADFIAALKQIPWTDRGYNADTKRWYVPMRYRDQVRTLAVQSFVSAEWHEGTIVENLHTGQRREQLDLFAEA